MEEDGFFEILIAYSLSMTFNIVRMDLFRLVGLVGFWSGQCLYSFAVYLDLYGGELNA